jgi:hypothetical protein
LMIEGLQEDSQYTLVVILLHGVQENRLLFLGLVQKLSIRQWLMLQQR